MYTITRENFDSLAVIRETGTGLQWSSIFVLPTWMQVWWQQFHTVPEPYLISVRDDRQVIGVAPLQIVDGVASLVGGDNVCDYLDFVVQPGFEEPFFNTVLDDLKTQGVRQLRLGLVRPDSTVITKLVDLARSRGFQTECQPGRRDIGDAAGGDVRGISEYLEYQTTARGAEKTAPAE